MPLTKHPYKMCLYLATLSILATLFACGSETDEPFVHIAYSVGQDQCGETASDAPLVIRITDKHVNDVRSHTIQDGEALELKTVNSSHALYYGESIITAIPEGLTLNLDDDLSTPFTVRQGGQRQQCDCEIANLWIDTSELPLAASDDKIWFNGFFNPLTDVASIQTCRYRESGELHWVSSDGLKSSLSVEALSDDTSITMPKPERLERQTIRVRLPWQVEQISAALTPIIYNSSIGGFLLQHDPVWSLAETEMIDVPIPSALNNHSQDLMSYRVHTSSSFDTTTMTGGGGVIDISALKVIETTHYHYEEESKANKRTEFFLEENPFENLVFGAGSYHFFMDRPEVFDLIKLEAEIIDRDPQLASYELPEEATIYIPFSEHWFVMDVASYMGAREVRINKFELIDVFGARTYGDALEMVFNRSVTPSYVSVALTEE